MIGPLRRCRIPCSTALVVLATPARHGATGSRSSLEEGYYPRTYLTNVTGKLTVAFEAKLTQTEGMADLTDAQWEYVKPLVEWEQERRQRTDRRGGRWSDARRVLDGVLWILRTGAPWHDLPPRYGPYQTCHRRFQQWQQAGVLDGILWALCEDLLARGELGLEETFIDASFAGAKKGAIALVQHAAAKGARSWQLRTAMVFLSPSGLQALRRMSPRWSKPRSPSATSQPCPSE